MKPAAAGMWQPRPHRLDHERASARDADRFTKQEPFAAGQAFANVGAYEKVVGRSAASSIRKARSMRRPLACVLALTGVFRV
jgi:hypothetical protein